MPLKNSHCSFCGQAFASADQPWPRTCAACGNISYRNPVPVAVVLLPVDGGLLAVRRTIPPGKGRLALPGGFINLGETWQEAGARELFEETGIRIDPAELRDFRVRSAAEGVVLIFGVARARSAAELPAFVATDETSERVVVGQSGPVELAFPLHTEALSAYLQGDR